MSDIDHDIKMEVDQLEAAANAVPKLAKNRTLVLNADLQPLRYNPLSTEPWTQIMFWLAKGWQREREGGKPIINVLEEYDDLVVRSANGRLIKLPSVVAFSEMQPIEQGVKLTRQNVFLRDNFRCQYTGKKHPVSDLTLDHVIPQSRGGKNSWDNLVTCSAEINTLKGDMYLDEFTKRYGYRLMKEPYKPTPFEMREKSKIFHPERTLHQSWHDYLYWDSELE